jgi:hypothetical protein
MLAVEGERMFPGATCTMGAVERSAGDSYQKLLM